MVFLPNVLLEVISDYAEENELLDWIVPEKIDWEWLSENPAAIHLLEKNPKKIVWEYLSNNPAIFKSSKNDIYNSLYKIQNWIYKIFLFINYNSW